MGGFVFFVVVCVLVGFSDVVPRAFSSPPQITLFYLPPQITLSLEQFVMVLDPFEHTDLKATEIVVPGTEGAVVGGGGGDAPERAAFPFSIALGPLEPDGNGWLETSTGALYALRHFVVATAHRPWWTYEVVRRFPLYLQRIEPAPAEDRGKRNADAPSDDAPLHVLPLSDVKATRCAFDYGETH